jgi:hypothetical protein
MSEQITVASLVKPKSEKALTANRRRALGGFVLSLLILPAWIYLWLSGNVSGWWVVLWILVVSQQGVAALFLYRWRPGPGWRRWLFRQLAFNFVWAVGVGLVVSRLSVTWMIAWYLFAGVWIGWMTLAYVRGRHKTIPDEPSVKL